MWVSYSSDEEFQKTLLEKDLIHNLVNE